VNLANKRGDKVAAPCTETVTFMASLEMKDFSPCLGEL
jgi:hypothetical protein